MSSHAIEPENWMTILNNYFNPILSMIILHSRFNAYFLNQNISSNLVNEGFYLLFILFIRGNSCLNELVNPGPSVVPNVIKPVTPSPGVNKE